MLDPDLTCPKVRDASRVRRLLVDSGSLHVDCLGHLLGRLDCVGEDFTRLVAQHVGEGAR